MHLGLFSEARDTIETVTEVRWKDVQIQRQEGLPTIPSDTILQLEHQLK